MSTVVEACCYINKTGPNRYELLPRTGLDNACISSFLDQRGRYGIIRLMNRAQAKSYDQTKAFWGLASLHYKAYNRQSPTSDELQYWYEDLLKPTLFPVRVDTVNEGKFVPKGWSELTKVEAIEVITKMISLVAEVEGLPSDMEADLKDIFEWASEENRKIEKEESEKPMEDVADELEDMEIF